MSNNKNKFDEIIYELFEQCKSRAEVDSLQNELRHKIAIEAYGNMRKFD